MRGKNKSARLNVTQAMLFVTIVALIPSALMMVFPEETARMLGSSEHLLPMVADYLLWFVPSWVFQIWITVSLFVMAVTITGPAIFGTTCLQIILKVPEPDSFAAAI